MDLAEVLVAGIAGGLFSASAIAIARLLKLPPQRSQLVIGLVAGLSVGAVAMARATGLTDWLSLSLGLKTQLDVDASHMASDLLNDPHAKAAFKGKSPQEARELGASLSRQGIPRMSADKLLVWAKLSAKMAAASPSFCAARWTGNMQPAFFADAFGKLSVDERTAWLDLSKDAMLLTLNNAPAPQTPPDILSVGFDSIFNALGPDAAELARRDAARTDLSDKRACELFDATINGALQLHDGTREGFLRALSQL